MVPVTYREAGVDVEKGERFASGIYELLKRTFSERVVENPGGFGSLFSLDYDEQLFRRNYAHPILVSSTDGVGTKLKLAFMSGRHDTVGIDLVAMCANDILVQGAEPLFFLDYVATGELKPETLKEVVRGIAEGCRRACCALLGGETAEMRGFYKAGEYDMAGFIVGVVEKSRLIDGTKTRPGHVLIGLPSSGLHSNGFTLVRHLLLEREGLSWDDSLAPYGIQASVAEELLRPTRIYVKSVRAVLHNYRVKQVITAIAHVTGGGLLQNLPRVLPEGCGAELDSSAWQRPPIFDVVRKLGDVEREEMYRTFNMGIGLVLAVSPYYADSVERALRGEGEAPVQIGRVVEGPRRVTIS